MGGPPQLNRQGIWKTERKGFVHTGLLTCGHPRCLACPKTLALRPSDSWGGACEELTCSLRVCYMWGSWSISWICKGCECGSGVFPQLFSPSGPREVLHLLGVRLTLLSGKKPYPSSLCRHPPSWWPLHGTLHLGVHLREKGHLRFCPVLGHCKGRHEWCIR